ncbi:MAG: MFS transporter [Caulobacterales bacterium]|jgi:PPP family 3-phenylpropionic acid transporter
MSRPSIASDPTLRLAAYLACLFAGTGVLLPFLPQWLSETRGLSGAEIALVISTPALVRIVIGPILGAWADGCKDRRTPLAVFAGLAVFAYGAFALADSFWALFVTSIIAGSLTGAAVPLAEGAALRASVAGRVPYGLARAVSSMAFIGGNLIGGALIARFGPELVVGWFLACVVAMAFTGTFALQPDPAPAAALDLSYWRRLALGFDLMRRNRRFALAIGAGALIQSAHGFYYNCSTLIWRADGVDAATIGVLWGLGVGAEVAFLASLPWIEKRFGPEALLVAGGAAATVRWFAMAAAPPLALQAVLQLLHAATFAAAYVGAIRIVQRETPDAIAGVGQTLYSGLASGLLMGLSGIGAGMLYDAVKGGGYLAMGVLAAAGLALALILARWPAPPKH